MDSPTLRNTKRIIVTQKHEPTAKEGSHEHCGKPTTTTPKTKLVAQTDEWNDVANAHNTQETQLQLIKELYSSTANSLLSKEQRIVLTHLKTKQTGYRSQDVIKDIYDPIAFVTIDHILHLLIESQLNCYYCKKWATIFYEFVRDPRQWSLERISNDMGHNCDNVVIACLECNMRRRTMYHERYLATKQLRVNKLEHEA
jgi:hypothetical protein